MPRAACPELARNTSASAIGCKKRDTAISRLFSIAGARSSAIDRRSLPFRIRSCSRGEFSIINGLIELGWSGLRTVGHQFGPVIEVGRADAFGEIACCAWAVVADMKMAINTPKNFMSINS